MKEENYFKFSLGQLIPPLFGMLLIWFVFWIEVSQGINLNKFGVLPRTLSGLKGVLFSPLIHGSLEHLYNNTLPLGILLSALFYFYRQKAWRIVLLGWLISGLLTWIIARSNYHIGASGLIYVFASFIFFKGIFQNHYRLIALSLAVVFIYGSLLWYIFPIEEGISWEGHLSGFITGLLLAKLIKVKTPETKKYEWEKADYKEEDDPFLKHFDENGNFIEKLPEEPLNEISVTYEYKTNKEQTD